MSIGNFPGFLNQQILAGIILVGRLGVHERGSMLHLQHCFLTEELSLGLVSHCFATHRRSENTWLLKDAATHRYFMAASFDLTV